VHEVHEGLKFTPSQFHLLALFVISVFFVVKHHKNNITHHREHEYSRAPYLPQAAFTLTHEEIIKHKHLKKVQLLTLLPFLRGLCALRG